MLVAPRTMAAQFRHSGRDFLAALDAGEFERIWDSMISLAAIELIATATFPLAIKKGYVRESLQRLNIEQMSYAFQLNVANIRTGFFNGFAASLRNSGWLEPFDDDSSHVFLWHDAALLVARRKEGKPTILPFVTDSRGDHKIDFEAVLAFSMFISAQQLHSLGTQAIELGQVRTALTIFEISARLSAVYARIRRLMWDHPIVGELIVEQRRNQLQAEYAYTILAKDQVELLMKDPELSDPVINIGHFLRETFTGYSRIPGISLDDGDMTRLNEMADNELRLAIAKTIIGVDRVEADREARKPHSAAEIADMELMVSREGVLYHVLIPIKTGREIRAQSVPVDVFYQILRPHLFFRRGVVVFITAKPCSQPLMNLIKLARDRHGWPIGVIEHHDLAKLFKLNELL